MDFAWLIPLLALMTLLVVLVSAIWSKEQTERGRKRGDVEKSSLAVDGDSHSAAP